MSEVKLKIVITLPEISMTMDELHSLVDRSKMQSPISQDMIDLIARNKHVFMVSNTINYVNRNLPYSTAQIELIGYDDIEKRRKENMIEPSHI